MSQLVYNNSFSPDCQALFINYFQEVFDALLGKKKWWAGMDSNHRSLRRRIYSPFPLTTRAPTHKKNGDPGGTRTPDPLIRSQIL